MRKPGPPEADPPAIVKYRARFAGAAAGESLSFAEANELFDAFVKLNHRLHRIARISDRYQSQLRSMEEERERLYEEVQQANNAKSEFLANVSHEIRTPLNAIVGLSHLALATEMTPQQRDYLGKIQSATRTLLGLVNDILDFTKGEAGKLALERVPFHLDQLLSSVAAVVAQRAEEKGLAIRFPIAPEVPRAVVGDPLRLGQALTNLADNAVKFTEKGEVVVGVEQVAREGKRVWLRFSVRDTGIGFSADQRERLFEAFTQGDGSTARKYGGTGLGLAITRQLIELMEGEIHAESTPGVGSTFAFAVPLGVDPAASAVPGPPEPAASAGLPAGARVLVVEDNAINQQVAREVLEGLGLAVAVVSNGRDAVERLAQGSERFDAVLMDVQMPGMDGYEATRVIRAGRSNSAIPIIAMTAHALESERQKCLAAGMNDHLAKPIEPDRLLAVLTRWIAPGAQPAAPSLSRQPQPAPLPGLPELPGVDLPAAMARLRGRGDLLLHLLHEFDRSCGETMSDLRAAVAEGDLERAGYLAHSLRGPAAMLSITGVSAAAGDLESALQEVDPQAAGIRLDALEKAVQSVLAGLAQLPPDPSLASPAAPAAAADPAVLAPLLRELSELLRESDLEATDRFRSVRACLGAGEGSPLLARLGKEMAQFDFETAHATLVALARSLAVPLSD